MIIRCGGKNMSELHEFEIYSPKVIALIGGLDSVLADRCLAIEMKRKTDADQVAPYRSRVVKPRGAAISNLLKEWAAREGDKVAKTYDQLEPFNIKNDRMAELLLPLQAVLTVGDPSYLPELEEYANDLEREEAETQNKSPGILLLNACRELFGTSIPFMPTDTLLNLLSDRREEPWHRWHKGEPLSAEALSRLLRPYGIAPYKTQKKVAGQVKTTRGYRAKDFSEAWARYLPSPPD